MQIDETELRRLVFVAQQRRMRFLTMPMPTIEQIESDDPAIDEQYNWLHEANVASLDGFSRLLDYLEDCLDMRSEYRKQ